MDKFILIFYFRIVLTLDLVYGDVGGKKPYFNEIKNENITANWRVSLISFIFSDKTGKKIDLLLRYNTIEEYQVLKTSVKAGIIHWTLWNDDPPPTLGRDKVEKVVKRLISGGEEVAEMRRRGQELVGKAKKATKEGSTSYKEDDALNAFYHLWCSYHPPKSRLFLPIHEAKMRNSNYS